MKNILPLIAFFSITAVGCGPSQFEREKLAFEEKKYNDEQAAKKEAAQQEETDKADQKVKWMNCRIASQKEYDEEFKTWGSPVPGKPGMRNGPAQQIQEMKNLLQRENEQCDRNFPKGISW